MRQCAVRNAANACIQAGCGIAKALADVVTPLNGAVLLSNGGGFPRFAARPLRYFHFDQSRVGLPGRIT